MVAGLGAGGMQAIHQGLWFAGDKSRKAGLLTSQQEPQAQQLRPGAAWLKVNLVQDVCLWWLQPPCRERRGPFQMHLAPVC